MPRDSNRKHQHGYDLGGSGHRPCWRERLGVVMGFEELGKVSARKKSGVFQCYRGGDGTRSRNIYERDRAIYFHQLP